MIKKIILAVVFVLLALFVFTRQNAQNLPSIPESPEPPKRVWSIKSADTMKYSRDPSLEKLNDPSFDEVINSQVSAIKNLNATHVAIGTPYDERFNPVLKRWVKAARNNGLRVWFRGNFAGWEGWFGEGRSLSREEHLRLTREFIQKHPDLFRNGDVFSPCPECENGGPGDPRSNGDKEGHRKFLIDERNAALEEFKNMGKDIMVLDSMNYDVARLVMDRETANSMGGIILVDHYVRTPEKLEADVKDLAASAEAKIMLGEFGVPIPDIHGNLSDQQQAEWIEKALSLLKDEQDLIGLNYWVTIGGSTAIYNKDSSPKPAVEVLKKYFSLTSLD